MKTLVCSVCLCLLSTFSFTQENEIGLHYNIQLHDFRSTFEGEATRHWSEGVFGTKELYIAFSRRVINGEKYYFNLGLGPFIRRSKTYSAFNNSLLDEPRPFSNVERITRYRKIGLVVPAEILYAIRKNYFIGLNSVCYVNFFSKFVNTRNIDPDFLNESVTNVRLDQVEINLSLGKRFGNNLVTISSRLLRLAPIDHYIFFDDFFQNFTARKKSNIENMNVDLYNPLKIDFSIRHMF